MKIKIIILLIIFYLGAMVITLPAEKAIGFIPDNSGVKVASASGRLWNGQASQISYKNQFQLQNVDWKVEWLALARLQLKLDIEFDDASQGMSGKGFVIFGFSGLSVENVIVDISAPELLSYANVVVPAEVSGDLSLVIKEASQGAPYCETLDGYLLWQNARIDSEIGKLDLDSAHMDLSCDNGQLVGNLQQESEQLTTTANIILQEKGIYRLEGLLKPEEKLSASMKNTLSWFGAKNQAGETILKFTGKL